MQTSQMSAQVTSQAAQASEQTRMAIEQMKLDYQVQRDALDREQEERLKQMDMALALKLQDSKNESAERIADMKEEPEDPVRDALASIIEPLTKQAESIGELAKSVSQPRRRVAVRDLNGELTHSDEHPIPQGE